jgi:hypothetical protein
LYHNALQSYEGYYGASSRPLYHSIFSAATIQFGSKALKPLDDERAWGWTAFTSLGTYNPDYGGHMILWDLRLLIRFPPGTTILIPRALVRYSFVKIAAHETRYCLMQYTPAPIFGFCSNGGRSDLEFARNATRAEHDTREAERAGQSDGELPMDILSTFGDLEELGEEIRLYPVSPRTHHSPSYPF